MLSHYSYNQSLLSLHGLGTQSSVVEDSIIPRYDLLVVLVPDILKDDNIFIYMVRQSMVKGLLAPLDPEDEGTTIP